MPQSKMTGACSHADDTYDSVLHKHYGGYSAWFGRDFSSSCVVTVTLEVRIRQTEETRTITYTKEGWV